MRSRTRVVAALLAALVLASTCVAGCASAQDEAQSLSSRSEDVYTRIDAYVRSAVKAAHIPALCLSIVNADRVLYSRAYGTARAQTSTPFLLGSVSKSFTALCIMQLVEEGKVDLDAPVSTWLPDVPDSEKVTVRQLLKHTGGLGQYQTIRDTRVVEPQGCHSYANVNYTLLGKIIEAVTGQSYETYIQEHVFTPLELRHAAATRKVSEENGLIQGYTDVWGFNMARDPLYPSTDADWITVPAGYLTASVEDLGRYLQMYLRHGEGIVGQGSLDDMLYGDTVYVEDEDVPYWYGYGWAMVRDPMPQPVYRHAGLVETGTSCVFLIPQSDLGVAITANVNDYMVGNDMLDTLGWGVVQMLLGEDPAPVDASEFTSRHLEIDIVLAAILVVGIVACCRVSRTIRRLREARTVRIAVPWALFHGLLPAFLLLAPRLLFGAPLWATRDFAPDIFITLIASAALLIASGVVELVALRRDRQRDREEAGMAQA